MVNSVSNATYTFEASHYDYDTTQIKIITNGTEVNGTYNVDYDYQQSATIFSMDFNFMGTLVLLGICFAIVLRITKVI